MVLPLAPILAQVLSAGVGDGIEARYVNESDTRRLEAENRAYARVGIEYPWLQLDLTYSPSVLLSPLEEKPRELSVTHTIIGRAETRATVYETRRMVAGFNLNGTLIQENSQRELFGSQLPQAETPVAPVDPMTPEDGATAAQLGLAENLTTRRAEGNADVYLLHRLSLKSILVETLTYRADSGLDRDSRVLYPLLHGPKINVSHYYALSRRDALRTRAEAAVAFIPSTGGRAWIAEAEEGITHTFSRKVRGDAAAGIVYTRSEVPGEETTGGLGPTALLGLQYNERVERGDLDARFELSYAPTLDRQRFVFDPRANAFATVDWSNDDWRLFVSTSSTISVDPDEPGALSGVSGMAGADYEIGAGFVAHTGVRAAWQEFENRNVVPATWVYYAGLSWSAELE
jgi:hypothetical protein